MRLKRENPIIMLVIASIVLFIFGLIGDTYATSVTINEHQLLVDGKLFTIKGVNYSPIPIGVDPEITPPYGDYFTSNYTPIYERDLPLLRQMGATTIRPWVWNNGNGHTDFLDKAYNDGIKPIYVIITFWMDPVLYPDISSPDGREKIKADFRTMVAAYKNHPAVLMWSIGNELNSSKMYGDKLGDLFSLINDMAHEAHNEEGAYYHPVITPLADIDLINTIVTYEPLMPDLDIWGANIYRGSSFGTFFNDFKAISGKPLIILGFGIDAYDENKEDEYENAGIPYQATYAESLWKEISANLDVCLGGLIRAYSDEWWLGKFGNTLGGCPDLDPVFHSPCGHPSSSSDPDGFVNYEWFGIMRVKKNGTSLDIMEPRKAYTTLKSLWAKEETTSPLGPQSKLQPQVENELNFATAFQSAEKNWKATRWEDALKEYKLITQTESPYAAKAHIQIGKYYKYHARWNEAIREYESAIAKGKAVRDIEDAQTSIAAVHLSKGDYQKALSLFQEVISNTKDWQQVKYSGYWIKELKRRIAFGEEAAGCNTCGSNAMKEVFKLKGIDFSDDEIDRLLSPSSGGVSMQEIKQFAESKGLKAFGAKLSMDQLKAVEMPLIALLDDPKHYVVIIGVEQAGVHIIDPENKSVPYLMPESAFGEMWNGYALVFSGIKPQLANALLSTDEMKNLKGKVCYCCPESNNGTQNPNAENKTDSCPGSSLIVNTVNLNLIYQATDLSYGGRGPGIEVTRTHNADDSRDGPFGHSWTFNYNPTLTENPNGSIDVRRETGSIHRFTSAGGGNYYPPKAVYDTLIKNPDGTYSLKLKGSKLIQKFNSSGKLLSITDRNGNSIAFQYDSNSRLINITDAAGRVATLNYGANGKISSIVDPLGRTASYSYDGNNNLTSAIDMAGNTVTYTYDSNSYMIAVTTSKGTTSVSYATSSYGYALKSVTDPVGNVRSYGTYGSDYNIRILDANGNPTQYDNNSDGYTANITDALQNSMIYGYDSKGNRTSIQDAKGNITVMTYDAKGNIMKITDPLSNNVQFTYDSNDNLTSLVDPAGNIYLYEYDSKSNLTKITDPKNGLTAFTYNSYGELTTLKDAKNNSISFAYDNFGNLTSTTNPLGGVDLYTYDAVGRVVSHTDPRGNTKSYSYDGINRLTRVTYPGGSQKNYTYDCCGLSSVTDSLGTLTFNRNNINRLTSFVDIYGKTISYGYDKAGNLTTLTYPDGKVVHYEYDNGDRLIKVTDWLSNITSYEYDPAGNLTKTVYPNGSSVINKYDNANRLQSILDLKSDATVNAVFSYTFDSLGNRTAVSFYQLLNAIPPTPTINYTYDADNRLLAAESTTFNYDNNGNLTTKTLGSNTATYAWDYNDMLTQLDSGGNTYSYKYEGLGNRIARIANSVETRYVVDPSGALSQVLAETDTSGIITAYYVYGLGLISKITPAGQTYYYHYDGIGSTIAINDLSGSIINKYAYDAFGKVLSEEETIANSFKYVGRFGVMDEGKGLLYMRARYYDQEVGRFINKDPIGLAAGFNTYEYAGNNVINYYDLNGRQVIETAVATIITTAIIGYAAYNVGKAIYNFIKTAYSDLGNIKKVNKAALELEKDLFISNIPPGEDYLINKLITKSPEYNEYNKTIEGTKHCP